MGSLFAAFLGYNPIGELLGPSGALAGTRASTPTCCTGKTFFPQLITEPFHSGLTVVFVAAAVMMLIGAVAAQDNAGRYGTVAPKKARCAPAIPLGPPDRRSCAGLQDRLPPCSVFAGLRMAR